MGSVNKVILVGYLGKDPEVKHTQAGVAVANFSLATSETWKDKSGEKQEKTEWHRIVAWDKLGEMCGEYLVKGRQVYIEGKLQTREWDDKDGNKRYTTEIVATNVTFLGKADSDGSAKESKPAAKPAATGKPASGGKPAAKPVANYGPPVDDDDSQVPF